MAAMFGREVQQTLMSPTPPTKIPVEDFQYSVDSGRASLGKERIKWSWSEAVNPHRDDDQGSQTSRRTRSPRKMHYHGASWEQQQDCRQGTDVREKSDWRQSSDVRERYDDQRSTDVRGRQYDRDSKDRSRRY